MLPVTSKTESAKMKTLILLLLLLLHPVTVRPQTIPPLWEIFAATRYVEKLNRELSMYLLYPIFPEKVKALEAKEVILMGFYVPLELENSHSFVISKYPMAECFFCGGAGPESVAVVYLKEKLKRKPKMDEILHVKGVLQLNEKDVEELNFIIKEAKIID